MFRNTAERSEAHAPPRHRATVDPAGMALNCATAAASERRAAAGVAPERASLPGTHPGAAPGPQSQK
jgi:hypothetical protein